MNIQEYKKITPKELRESKPRLNNLKVLHKLLLIQKFSIFNLKKVKTTDN